MTVNVFDLLVAPSLQRRRDAFFRQLGEDLASLAGRVSDLEDRLAEHEDKFATLALNASLAAVRTTDERKLQRLRNAVMNGAVGRIDESMGEMFIQAVSDLTPLHVDVLVYLSDPSAMLRQRGLDPADFERGPRSAAFAAAFPDIGTHPHELGGAILRELFARGFTLQGDLGRESSDAVVLGSWVTDLGLMFLSIVEPVPA